METIENASGCPAIDQLVESSKTLDNGETAQKSNHLEWIPYSEFTDIVVSIVHSTSNQPTHYATYEQAKTNDKLVEMLRLGTVDECTRESIHEFAKTHSLPTHECNNPPNIAQFRRFSTWLKRRNGMIERLTRDSNNYYLVA